jgi:hypothetical protein
VGFVEPKDGITVGPKVGGTVGDVEGNNDGDDVGTRDGTKDTVLLAGLRVGTDDGDHVGI